MLLMLDVIFFGFCSRWYPVVRHLNRFLIAVARAVVNHDDGSGTAPDPLVWSAGFLPKRPRVLHAVRDFAFLPGPVGIWDGDWVSFGVSGVTAEDVRVWPYSVSLLVKVSAFLGTLHWPAGAVEFGVGGVSFVEMLIVLRVLFLGIGGLDVQFQCRLFLLVQALIFGAPVGFLEPSFVHCVCCLVVLVGFSLGILGLIMVPFDTLVGKSAVMVLRPGHVRLLLFGFWMSFSFFLGIQLPVLLVGSLLAACLRVAMLLVCLPPGSWFGVVLVLCLLLWVVLVFAWLEVLVEALKESDYTEKHQHTLLDRVFRGPGSSQGLEEA